MKNPGDRTLAVIGGGASATLFLAHLALIPDIRPLDITVFDRTGTFGTGIAYGTKDSNHPLNVRVKDMSALQHDLEDFSRWAATKGYGAGDFTPRILYGEYLAETLAEATKLLNSRRHSLNFIKADVLGAKKNEGGSYTIETKNKKYEFAKTLLATGNVAPTSPAGAEKLKPADGYFENPWTPDYKSLSGDVTLLGTGLSMVDAVLSLSAAGFQGNIRAISRRGLLPAGHAAPLNNYSEFIDDSPLPRSPCQMLRLVRGEVIKAAKNNIPWQAVIDSLRPHTNLIWQSWPAAEQEKFLRRLFVFWNVHRHRMPPQSEIILRRLMHEKKLTIVKDNVQEIAAGIEIFCLKNTYKAENAINCLGYRYGAPPGFEGAYLIGPALWPHCLETTALKEIRAQAADLARAIAIR